MTSSVPTLPVHQPDVYNIDAEVTGGGWRCVGNRRDERDALSMAGRQVALTGRRHRVCTPGGKVVFDSASLSGASAQEHDCEPNEAARSLKLEYTTAVDECFRIQFDQVHQLAVIGDRANATYEWVIEVYGKILAHSNDGYGVSSIALRDGLIAYHGLGEVTEPVALSSD